jgi:polysaccharide deacetylase family protein (PEP-CTERM system associated)
VTKLNLLGIDFEEWYHPELVQPHIKDDKKKPQVFNGIDNILDWLRKNNTFATFFTVGEILEANPEILDKIIENGHEIAFHTMHHKKLDITTKEEFNKQIQDFAKITNKRSKGFRAPTFSLNHSTSWSLDVLTENNYVYDSSVVPAKTRLYGIPDADTKPYKISSKKIGQNSSDANLLEFPLMVTKLFGKKIPAGGGFYLRFLPLITIENVIKKYEMHGKPATFYIHSWELTPEYMPKISLPFSDRFITYHNLHKAMSKMDSLVKKFKFTSFEKHIERSDTI